MPYKFKTAITVQTKTKEVLDKDRDYNETWDNYLRYLFKFHKKHSKNNKKINTYI